jgi:hypothetical protein
MKAFIAAAVILAASQAIPAHAGVNFNLSIGLPAVVAAVPPPAIYAPPRVLAGAAPEFIYSPSLGIYVSAGTPVEVFFTGGSYYRYDRGNWYSSPRYNGHWARANGRGLPPELTRHRYDQIRYYRDRDCRHHMETRDHGRNDHRGDWRRHDRDRGERYVRGYGERRM